MIDNNRHKIKYRMAPSSQNHISKEELEAQRHAEGVDAFLTFATEVSSMSSPIKRPPSADYMENIPNEYLYETSHPNNHNHSNNVVNMQPHIQNSYTIYQMSPSPPKKPRSRTLRTKLKKKAWLR